MNAVFLNNVIFYNNNFYTEKKNLNTIYLHNRLKDIKYNFILNDINNINIDLSNCINYDSGIILLHHFHYNPAHNMWDHIYPVWYTLYYNNLNIAKDENFQFMTINNLDKVFGISHFNDIKVFSGSIPITKNLLFEKYNTPIIIPWFICGVANIGISHIYKNTLSANMGLQINNINPVELFVNRFYKRYNIQRNSLHNKESLKFFTKSLKFGKRSLKRIKRVTKIH